jgi:NADH-quinone oxidoreductase subunit M
MITLLLLLFPALASLALLVLNTKDAKRAALLFSIVELAIALYALLNFQKDASTQFLLDTAWVSSLGIHFKIGIDGISMLMVMLTTALFPLIILSTFNKTYTAEKSFYALMLFMQAGLIGVFVSLDAFLFYTCWEAALIPVYFIAAIWGGADRIQATLKFFVYTILGSLLMLAAIIYIYLQTPGTHSFDINVFYQTVLNNSAQGYLFWAFFIAFAIKMPVFPFHTWQPDTYTEAPTPATMLLSAIMLKMGIYGVIRWMIPIVPQGFQQWSWLAITLSIIGIVYASIIAFNQKDLKRLIAYSSIAHVGLIAAGVFVFNAQALQGAMIQMLSHGVNVFALFYIIYLIESRTDTRQMNLLGGIVHSAPKLAITFTIIMMGSIALPLTNGFVGEFLLLMGLYQYSAIATTFAGLTIILGAVYMLRMYQRVMLGEANNLTNSFKDINGNEKTILYIVVLLVVVMGVMPNTILSISDAAIQNLISIVNSKLVAIN